MYRRIAIIGGGAAGAVLLGELLERSTPQPLHLDWYTGTGTPGLGVAYATRSDRHLLNVRAASMGMFAGKPQGFLDDVQRDDPTIAGTAFLPRWRYGDYLEAELARALAAGKARGHDVRVLRFEADAVVPEADGVTVLHAEETRRADAAVLAIGSLPARPLPGVDTAALASGRYVLDPWAWLAALPAAGPVHVAIVGLGLTAADVIVELAARWPATRFTALSRHGRWPQPHSPVAALPSGDSADLIDAMLDAASVRRWLPMVREAIAQEEDWRCTIDSLRPHLSALWASLPTEQRSRFQRHLRSLWERVRHRMPVPEAETIAALEREGRLVRLAGHLDGVGFEHGQLAVRWHPRGGGEPHMLQADWAVQATGMDFDAACTDHRLLHQLVLNRHVLPDPFGLGCQATPQGRLLHAGGAWTRLFAIGGLLRGTLGESTAMPELRQQARAVADQLLAESNP